jgi:hypothetical protein
MLALPLLVVLAADTAQAEQTEEDVISIDSIEETGAPVYDPVAIAITQVQDLGSRPDPLGVAYLVELVRGGLPPAALVAFLDVAITHPQPEYVVELERLADYRRAEVRARAYLALSRSGGAAARVAATKALDDPDLRLRLLGVELVRRHTAPDLEEAAMRLIERDPTVAAALRSR